MNKEEIDKWLDNEYGMSYTRLEELLDFYFKKYCNLRQENEQLKEKITKAKIYMRDKMSLREYSEHYMNIMLILKGDSNE